MIVRGRRAPQTPQTRLARGVVRASAAPPAPDVINGYQLRILSPTIGQRDHDGTPTLVVVATHTVTGGGNSAGDGSVTQDYTFTVHADSDFGHAEQTYTVHIGGQDTSSLLTADIEVQLGRASGSADDTLLRVNATSGASTSIPLDPVPASATKYGVWWYRVRAGNADSGVWGAWTAWRWFDYAPVSGSAAFYTDMNVGVAAKPRLNATAYLDMNVGISTVPPDSQEGDDPTAASFKLIRYLDMNIGVDSRYFTDAAYLTMNVFRQLGSIATAAYLDLNLDPDLQPEPDIWKIRPPSTETGRLFSIIGFGFGDRQSQFNGQVRIGNIVMPAPSIWRRVPAQPLTSTVTVAGIARRTASVLLPAVLLAPGAVYIEAGDIIEYDLYWDQPSNIALLPSFSLDNVPVGTQPSVLLPDDTGRAWAADIPAAYGAWTHRRHVVAAGSPLVGRQATNFAFAWYGTDPAQNVRSGALRAFVVRNAAGAVKLWATGDDNQAPVPLTYVANTSTLVSSKYTQDGHRIIFGDSDKTDDVTPEHDEIVVLAGEGAASDLVYVVLEGEDG